MVGMNTSQPFASDAGTTVRTVVSVAQLTEARTRLGTHPTELARFAPMGCGRC